MATYSKYVDPNATGSGDGSSLANAYTSLSAWEAAEQTLYVSGDIAIADCWRTGATKDTTAVTVTGWTAGVIPKIIVNSAHRHAGKWADQQAGGNYIYILQGILDGSLLNVATNNCYAEGLLVNNTHGNGKGVGETSGGSTGTAIDSCIIKGAGSGSTSNGIGDGGGPLLVTNSIIFDCLYGDNNHYAIPQQLLNCTIVNCGYGIRHNDGGGGTTTAKNCYVGNITTTEYVGSVTRTTCMHSSATSYSGSTANIAYSTANFTNVTAGSEDLHLVSGSALIDVGTDLSATFTTDIDGATRSGTWDIGADEYVAAGGGVVIPVLTQNMRGGFDLIRGGFING